MKDTRRARAFWLTRKIVFMYVLTISHIGCFSSLYLSSLQLAHILPHLNIAVVKPSHLLQDQARVRFLVPFQNTSVALIPAPMNPPNFRKSLRLITNLPLSKFLKRKTKRCASLRFYDRRRLMTSVQRLYVARPKPKPKPVSGKKDLKYDTWWARCILFVCCVTISKRDGNEGGNANAADVEHPAENPAEPISTHTT